MNIHTVIGLRLFPEKLKKLENYVNKQENKNYFRILSKESDSKYSDAIIQYSYNGIYFQKGVKILRGLLKIVEEDAKDAGWLEKSDYLKRSMTDFFNTPVGDLNLSIRTRKRLIRKDISSIGELIRYSSSDLLEIYSFGETSLNEIRTELSDLGLHLRGDGLF